jgi:hypothetical protein
MKVCDLRLRLRVAWWNYRPDKAEIKILECDFLASPPIIPPMAIKAGRPLAWLRPDCIRWRDIATQVD